MYILQQCNSEKEHPKSSGHYFSKLHWSMMCMFCRLFNICTDLPYSSSTSLSGEGTEVKLLEEHKLCSLWDTFWEIWCTVLGAYVWELLRVFLRSPLAVEVMNKHHRDMHIHCEEVKIRSEDVVNTYIRRGNSRYWRLSYICEMAQNEFKRKYRLEAVK